MDWPTKFEFIFANVPIAITPPRPLLILEQIRVWYGDTKLERAGISKDASKTLVCELKTGEYIKKIRIWESPGTDNRYGDSRMISFIEITTSENNVLGEGHIWGDTVVEFQMPDGCLGLKGFYGLTEYYIPRLGPIWGTK